MALFDSIVSDARAKFNLGDKTETLLSAVLALITSNSRGGLRGFLDRFNQADLSDVASSWVNSDANTPISNEQLESALGADTLQEINNQVGGDYKTTTSATAYMIPHIVDNLTPNGELPEENDVISQVNGYQSSLNAGGVTAVGATGVAGTTTASQTFDRVGTAASEFNDPSARALDDRTGSALNRNVDDLSDDVINDDSPLKWIIPLALLGLMIALGSWFCGKSEPVATTTTNVNVVNSAVNSNSNANTSTVNANH
jgi:uncharacterized protein YidB (DUF937 family)